MTPWHRRFVHQILLGLRQTRARRPILAWLVKLHNVSYHMISFFASHKGVHPKHAILDYHQFFVDHIKPSDRVLDLGAGRGEVAYDVAAHAATVVGIDNHLPSVEEARKRYQRGNLSFEYGDITDDDFEGTYDVIMLSNVLEHIEKRPELLRKAAEVAPRVLIRVPMLHRDWVTVFKKNEGFEYRLDHTHFTEYTAESLRGEIEAAGLSVTSMHAKFGELYAVCDVVPVQSEDTVAVDQKQWQGVAVG